MKRRPANIIPAYAVAVYAGDRIRLMLNEITRDREQATYAADHLREIGVRAWVVEVDVKVNGPVE